MKKKNIIWLCANIAVFALFAFFHSVKFVAAAAVVYSAASRINSACFTPPTEKPANFFLHII